MNNIDWNMVSAIANVIVAVTAVIAAWYALRQYRSSNRIHEVEQILSMYHATADVLRQSNGKTLDYSIIKASLDLLELHERLIAFGLLSPKAIEFYRDAISINDDIADISEANLQLIKAVLSTDKRGYRHLIASLQKNALTKHIVDW